MKKILSLLFMTCCLAFVLKAQQDAQYTQFMFNKLALNPGYAISTDYACVSCLHRSQWVGLDGAPTSQSLNVRVPYYKKHMGMGISINHDVIGPTNSWLFSLIYAYRMPLGKGNLGIGLQGSLRSYKVDWNSTVAIQSGDGLIPDSESTTTLPNFGFGLYYHTPKYYVGLSVPHLLDGDLSFFDNIGSNLDYSREERHAFLMAGTILKLSKDLKFKPAFIMKYVKDTPFDMDINGSLIFFDKLWAGLTYRLGGFHDSIGESLDLVLQYQLTSALKAGFAYDFTLSKVRMHNSGTYEIMIDYCLNPGKDRLTNPRFF